jgi:hypothetical protein
VQQYRPSPNSPRTIADGIEYHTHPSFGLKMEGWSASMQDDGTVLVSLTVRHVSDNSEVHADWTYDPKTRIVTPANPLAAFLATMAGTG